MIRFNHQPGLVLYLTCGDPSPKTTVEIALAAIDAGADVIELGVPFSDPVADGPVIQRASERALRNNTSLADVLNIARQIRQQSDAGLIVFSYLNPLMRYGLQRFCTDAAAAGIDGALVTDMPIEEAAGFRRMMQDCRLETVFLAAPTSTDARLRSITAASTGFVYAVSRTGVTGAQRELAQDVESLVKRIRRFTKLPIALGFGVSTPDQFAAIGRFADAAVVGSAVMQIIEQNPETAASTVADFVRKLVGNRSLVRSGC